MALQLIMREQLKLLDFVKKNNVKYSQDLYYSGNSQGGIYGQTVMAVTPYVERGHLGQAGNDYSTLLHRSVDFGDYFPIIRGVWPDTHDQLVMLSMMQVLWDTVDPSSWARHIEHEPLPGNKAHHAIIVLHPGDFQVAPVTDEKLVRSDLGFVLMKQYGQ